MNYFLNVLYNIKNVNTFVSIISSVCMLIGLFILGMASIYGDETKHIKKWMMIIIKITLVSGLLYILIPDIEKTYNFKTFQQQVYIKKY